MQMPKSLTSVILGLFCILLTSCMAAVVAGAAGLVYDKRSVVTLEADTRLFHLIHTAIVTNPDFRQSHVEVTSFNRIVLLVGQTPSAALKAQAWEIAKSTPGVLRVYNELSVAPTTPLAQKTKDSWITSQVRSAMLTRRGLESGSIRVVTENAVVYLMGIVTDEQANLSVDVARRISGVAKVVKIFQYIR